MPSVMLFGSPAVVAMSPLSTTPNALRYVIAGVAVVIIITMVTISTRRGVAMASAPSEPAPAKELPAEQTVEVAREQSEAKVDKLAN